MDRDVECTHCHVVMTSWSAPGSPVRYYQCPFCARTHSSPYGEVFRHGAGARVLAARSVPGGIPTATADEVRWAGIKASAARWFARLDAEERARRPPCDTASPPTPLTRARSAVPLVDPRYVIALKPTGSRRKP